MTSLIQVASWKKDYIIDPFSTHETLRSQFKLLMESERTLKILHGAANDVLNFQRCFGINVVHAIDTQILHQCMLQRIASRMEMLDMKSAVKGLNHVWVTRALKIDIEVLMKKHQYLPQTELSYIQENCNANISFNNFVKIYYPAFESDDITTLADWRLRPLHPQMLKYARDDVHILLRIFSYICDMVINF